MDVVELIADREAGTTCLVFYCEACKGNHSIYIKGAAVPVWKWCGSKTKPTFKPSVRVRASQLCHFFVRKGKIQYLPDCTHGYAGATVKMSPIERE